MGGAGESERKKDRRRRRWRRRRKIRRAVGRIQLFNSSPGRNALDSDDRPELRLLTLNVCTYIRKFTRTIITILIIAVITVIVLRTRLI